MMWNKGSAAALQLHIEVLQYLQEKLFFDINLDKLHYETYTS